MMGVRVMRTWIANSGCGTLAGALDITMERVTCTNNNVDVPQLHSWINGSCLVLKSQLIRSNYWRCPIGWQEQLINISIVDSEMRNNAGSNGVAISAWYSRGEYEGLCVGCPESGSSIPGGGLHLTMGNTTIGSHAIETGNGASIAGR
jgi:hypothetical protein